MKEEQAAELVNKNLKRIRKTIKSKAAIYALDFKLTYKRFVEELKENDYEVVRKIPDSGEFENHLTDLLKNFLIRLAYFRKEEEDFIPKVITHLSKEYKFPLSFRPEIVEYVKAKIEEAELKKLNQFRESSKFTTFSFRVIKNLAIDYVRKNLNKKVPEEILVPPDIIDKFLRSGATPEDSMILVEEEEIKQKITGLLSLKVEQLNINEKIAFKLYYYENINNISRIARDLGITRHKAEAMIKRTWNEILSEIKKEIERFLKSRNKPSNKD